MHKCLAFAYFQQKRICENFLADLSKVHLSCPQQNFEKKTIFLMSHFFSGFLIVSFMPYGKTNSSKLSKLHLPYSRGFLWKKVFLQIFEVFSSLLHFKQKVLSLSVGKGRNGCHERILRVQNINFLVENLTYPQLFIILVLTAKNSLRKCFGRPVKSVLVWTTVKLWGKLVFWSFVFLLGFWIRKWCLMAKTLSEVVKTSFSESRRSFFSLAEN